MRKPLSLIVADIIGIVFALTMIFMASYLGFYTIRDSPELQALFWVSLALEVIAALLLLAKPVLDLIIAANKLTVPDQAHRCVTLLFKALDVISPILAIFAGIRLSYMGNTFLPIMAFVAYPFVLLIGACGFSLIGCFLKQPEQPEQPDR